MDDDQSNMAEHDAYRNMEGFDVKPKSFGSLADTKKAAAKSNLVKNEQGATGQTGGVGSGLKSALNSESLPAPFKNSVTGKNAGGKFSAKGNGDSSSSPLGILNTGSASGIIGIVLFVIGGIIAGSGTTLLGSVVDQLRTTYDSITTVFEKRSDTFLKLQLDEKDIKNPIAQKYFGFGGTKFKLSSKQKTKLASQGIYTVDDYAGTGRTALLFDDGSGKLKIVGSGSTDVDAFKGKNMDLADVKTIPSDVDISKLSIDVDDVVTFSKAYTEIPDFRNGYIKSSRTWRGAVGAWFDSVAVRFLQSNGLTRNLFKDFQNRVADEANGNTKSAVVETLRAETDSDGLSFRERNSEVEYQDGTDEDGDPTYKTEPAGKIGKDVDGDMETHTKSSKMSSRAEIKAKMAEIEADFEARAKITGEISMGINLTCALFSVVGNVQQLIKAAERSQLITIVAAFLEASDKAKTTEGSESPVGVWLNALTEPADTYNEILTDDNYTKAEVVRENMTAMQSQGISSLYTGKSVDYNDASVKNFSFGGAFSNAITQLTSSIMSFSACAYAKIAAATANLAIDIAKIVACAASFGIGCIVELAEGAAVSAAYSLGVAAASQIIISTMTPVIVTALTRDVASRLAGEDFGNAIADAVNMYMGENDKQGGGTPMTRSTYLAFLVQKQDTIANEARYQRETRSPFDASSQYTFLGTLVTKLTALSTIRSTPLSIISSIGTMTTNSVAALLPSASALEINEDILYTDEEYSGICSNVASIGATGDAFCNPYFGSDVSTISTSPDDIVDAVDQLGGLEEDGTIDKTSDLAKFINFCDQRQSVFGIADANIAGNFGADVNTDSQAFNTAANSVIGAIPVIGDGLDIFTNEQQLANAGWITGESCVAGNSIDEGLLTESIGWDEAKIYQRFIGDQRIMESMDDEYTSVVSLYLDEYYAENPLDNSYEGILARKSGMTKDDVVALLDYIDYTNYVANYDPTERLQFAPTTEEVIYFEDGAEEEQPFIIIQTTIAYADLRNRNFAA